MKKLLAILGVITCMVGLCACGKEEAQPSADNAADEMIIQQFEAMVDDMVDRVVTCTLCSQRGHFSAACGI